MVRLSVDRPCIIPAWELQRSSSFLCCDGWHPEQLSVQDATLCYASSDRQTQLAAHMAVLQQLLCVHRLFQRQRRLDGHPELSRLDHAAESVQHHCPLRSDNVDRSDAALGELRGINGIDRGEQAASR